MNPYMKGFLLIFAAALVAGGGVALTTHDLWAIGTAVCINVGTTLTGFILQGPRKEWTDEERAAKVVPPAVVPPVVKPA